MPEPEAVNSMSLHSLVFKRDQMYAELKQLGVDYERNKKRIEGDIQTVVERIKMQVDHGLDVTKIETAENILEVYGLKHFGAGETAGVVHDAIKWFSGQDLGPYKNLRRGYYGCKDYDRWHCQRSDCDYGMSPRHGHIVFSIGLKCEKANHVFTTEEKDACIYFLMNIQHVQKVKETFNATT